MRLYLFKVILSAPAADLPASPGPALKPASITDSSGLPASPTHQARRPYRLTMPVVPIDSPGLSALLGQPGHLTDIKPPDKKDMGTGCDSCKALMVCLLYPVPLDRRSYNFRALYVNLLSAALCTHQQLSD